MAEATTSSGCDDRQLLVDAVEPTFAHAEGTDDLRIELRAVMREYLVRRLFPAEGRSIGTIARHRVERVGEGEDARAARDPVAGQAAGIAAAVPAFVMRLHHAKPFALEQPDAGQNLDADRGMQFDQAALSLI